MSGLKGVTLDELDSVLDQITAIQDAPMEFVVEGEQDLCAGASRGGRDLEVLPKYIKTPPGVKDHKVLQKHPYVPIPMLGTILIDKAWTRVVEGGADFYLA